MNENISWVSIQPQRENGNEKEQMTTTSENKESLAQGTSVSKQQLDFVLLFEFTEDEKLIEDYACAYQKDKTFAHGRIYFSEHYLSFFSSLFAAVKLKVPISTIIDVQKKNTAILFPNAIEITLKDQQKLFFSSFLYRDKAFQTLSNLLDTRGKVASDVEVENINGENVVSAENSKNSTIRAIKTNAINISNSNSSSSTNNNNTNTNNDSMKKFSHKSFDESVLKKESTSPSSSSSTTASILSGKERSNSSNAMERNNVTMHEISSDIESESSRKRRSLSFTIQQLQSGASIDIQDRSPSSRSSTLSHIPIAATTSTTTPISTPTATPTPLTKSSSVEPHVTNNNNTNNTTDQSSLLSIHSSISRSASATSFVNIPENISCNHVTEFKEEFYINEHVPNISMEKFFSFFLADGSEFWLEVNKEFNYAETTITPWMQEPSGKCCIYRNLTFIAPVTQRFGPKSTKVMQTHRIRFNSNKQLMIETFSTSKDVPYGDSFNVVNRFLISNVLENQENKNKGIQFQAATFIKFSRSVWGIQSMIEKSASASGKEFSMKFFALAKQKLTKMPLSSIETPSPRNTSTSDIPATDIQDKNQVIPILNSIPVSPPSSPISPISPISSSSSPSHSFTGLSKARLIQEYGESTSFMKITALISITTLVILFLLFIPFTFQIFSRINILEQQNLNMHRSTEKLESKIEFMEAIIEALMQNNSQFVDQNLLKYIGKDKAGMTLGELWRTWKMNGEIISKYEYWKKQLFELQEEIILAKNFLDGSSSILETVANQPSSSVVSVWGIVMYILELIVLLLLLTTAIVVLYLQFYQKKFKQD